MKDSDTFFQGKGHLIINRIWVVSEVYYPEETGTGYFMTKIAEGLASAYAVKVLCGQASYSSRGIRSPRKEQHNGVDIMRCHTTSFNKDRLIPRIVNIITISHSIFVNALLSFRKGDLVLVGTNPPLLPFIAMFACFLRGAKYIVRVDDVYPEMLVVAGLMDKNSAVFRMMNWFTTRLYHRAERIIVMGRDMSLRVSGKMSRHLDRVLVITNWADTDLILPAPREKNQLLNELGLMEKFVVLWAGNMGHPHDVESIFAAMVKLKDYPDIHFLFIGAGYKRIWLERQAQSAELKNVTFLGNRPRTDQQSFLNACDIAMSSFIKGMSGLGVPSRTYNILAAGKPILAIGEPDSEVAFVLSEERVGWLVLPGEPEQIVQAIFQARNKRELTAEMGRRGRIAVETKYSSEIVINKYIGLIKNLNVVHKT
jgi:glycosyltransferase involved in cell wall biosynthesis